MSNVHGVCVDTTENVYLADVDNQRIRSVTSSGEHLMLFHYFLHPVSSSSSIRLTVKFDQVSSLPLRDVVLLHIKMG